MFGRLSIVVVAIVATAGCMGGSEPPAPSPAAPAPAQPNAPAPPPEPEPEPAAPVPVPVPEIPAAPEIPVGPYELATGMANGAFEDADIQARPQVTITWTNRDSLVHSVVSSDGRFAGSGPVQPGGEFTATFLTPGEYPFHCRYHWFTGVVTVA